MTTPPPANSPKPSAGVPLSALLLTSLFAAVGLGLLGYAVFLLLAPPSAPAATPTSVAQIPTPIVIPTTTPVPTLPPPTATPEAPTATVTPDASPTESTETLTVNAGANVRTGPGTVYPILGSALAGEKFPVIGRDATAQWYVIQHPNGQGWIAAFVTSFAGDANALPVVAAPPPPPTAVPTNTPLPTGTSAPAATATPAGYISRGVQGVSFTVENTSVGPGQDVWFRFKVVNTTDQAVSYSVLAAHTDGGVNAQSWTNETLQPKGVLEWRDHINYPNAGTYQVYLGICYGGKDACLANQVGWDRLSASVTVTVK